MEKKTKIALALVAALGVTSVSSMVLAHGERGDRGERGAMMFAEMDADNDGFITQAEMDAHKAARFAEQDTNNDGKLSKEELVAAIEAKMAERGHDGKKGKRMEKRVDRMFERMDANSDGAVTLDELGAGKDGDRFAKLDANGDGKISMEEAEAMKGKRGGKGDRKGKNKN